MRTRLLFTIAALSLPLSAQTLDTAILGTITDQSGAVVATAAVTIAQPATGQSRLIKTTPDGKYEVRYLLPGEYTVEVKAAGFRTERRTGIHLQIGQQARLDFQMEVGEVVETVEVAASGPILQTESAVLGRSGGHRAYRQPSPERA